jgi:hypothetical protein
LQWARPVGVADHPVAEISLAQAMHCQVNGERQGASAIDKVEQEAR